MSFASAMSRRIGQVSLECINSRVPLKLLSLLEGKDVLVGVIDVATDELETPQRVAQVIGEVMKFVPREKIIACTNCGMAPMRREIAEAKLLALGQGAALARKKYG
jgi:5-methyltetrahydropteroyltriglutamate--homocysteine methyltransferase